jgi:phosphate transport system protein
MTDHTVKAFDDEIGELRGHIAEMGGRAEAAITSAMQTRS